MLDRNDNLLNVGDIVRVSLLYSGKILAINIDEDVPEGINIEYALVSCENGILKAWSWEIKKEI